MFCLVSAADDLGLLPDLAEAGVAGFQVRAKGLDDRRLLELVRAVRAALRGLDTTLVVNDRVDLALAGRADGVHLGRQDLPVAEARRIAPQLLIGSTCRTREEVEVAKQQGADYAGFGPVFRSSSKLGLPDPLGVEAVEAAAGALPLVAIGGIDAGRAGLVKAAGAHGVAVIGAIWRQPSPIASARELVAALG